MSYSARYRGVLVLIVAVMLVVTATNVITPSALAATNQGSSITTSPISDELNIEPGQTKSTTLQMENNSSQPVQIAVILDTFHASGTSGQAAISKPTANDPSPNWVHFSQTSFIAQPGVWTPIQMTISLPKDATLGYYYAVLFKPVLAINKVNLNTNIVTSSNAVLILVDTASANETRQLQVTSFTASHKLYEYLPATFSVTVRNTGNIFLPPEGSIYITRSKTLSSNILATLSLNQSGGRVLPGSSRVFSSSWTNGFPVFQQQTLAGQPVLKKNGQPVEQLHWDFANTNHFRFGHYYAQLALVYSNGQRDIPIYGTVSFWVIPWKLLLIILIIIALQVSMVIAVLRYRHMYRKNKLNASKNV